MVMTSPEQVARFHEAFRAWMRAHHPHVTVDVVMSVMSYEIGRLAGSVAHDQQLTDPEIEDLLDDIRDTMRDHIEAYRRGMRH